MTFKQLSNNPGFIKLSHGNKKLKASDKIAFLVWNLPAVITCPFRTPHCEGSCYACKAERCYPSVTPSRMDHFEISKSEGFVDRMLYTIDAELTRKAHCGKKIVFRIHESGDFYNKAYADKWIEIARHYEGNKRIEFLAYTKSVKFFDGVDLPSNLHILASVWDDTKADNLEIIERTTSESIPHTRAIS